MGQTSSVQVVIHRNTVMGNFWNVYTKNVLREIKQVVQQLHFLYTIIAISFIGFIIFLAKFHFLTTIIKIGMAVLGVYSIVKYATVLPMESLFLFLVMSPKWTGMVLSLAVVYSFFKVILI